MRMRIYSVLSAWTKAHKECGIPDVDSYFKNKKMCEHCIKGQCIMTWIFGWFLIFSLCLVSFFGYRWLSYKPVTIPEDIPSTAPENAERPLPGE